MIMYLIMHKSHFRLSEKVWRLLFCRRQELRELRLLQKEEQRAQQQLSNKLQQQKEQLFRRFEQEMTVSTLIPSLVLFTFNIVIHCHPLFIVHSFVLSINTEKTVLVLFTAFKCSTMYKLQVSKRIKIDLYERQCITPYANHLSHVNIKCCPNQPPL